MLGDSGIQGSQAGPEHASSAVCHSQTLPSPKLGRCPAGLSLALAQPGSAQLQGQLWCPEASARGAAPVGSTEWLSVLPSVLQPLPRAQASALAGHPHLRNFLETWVGP